MGPWFDAQSRVLSYTLVAPVGTTSVTFLGQGSFDGVNVSIGGQAYIADGSGGDSNQTPIF